MRHKLVVFLAFALVLLLGGFLYPGHLVPSAQAELFRPVDVGNSPSLIKLSQLLGGDRQSRTLQMSVGLALRNQEELNALLRNLYDPSSSQYHQYLTVAQFTQEFGPTAAEQQAVIDYLTQQGFTVTGTYPDRLLVDFSGPEALAERVFGVTINSYRAPDGRQFFANRNTPRLPAYIAQDITSLTGLDDASQFFHPPIVSQNSSLFRPKASNCPGPGQSGSSTGTAYIPSQLSTAYDYDGLHSAGLQGQGQTVGVFELDGYSASDIQAYTQCFGGGSVPLQNVILDGFNGQPGAGAIEVELDIETIVSMAPNLSKLIVYEAPNTTQGYNDEFARIVSDRTPVVSVSWGQCETAAGQTEAQQENTFFQEAAAQGQTILVAAGDSGSETCFEQTYDPSLVADDPAAQPYVTGVGGTTLSLNSNNSYQSEHVWNDGFFGGAGGGGLSQYWKQPSWQTGPGVQNSYSNGMRETPDVSLNADPQTGYNVYCTVGSNCTGSGLPGVGGGGWITVGGTSAAAPMWAAMIALTNQEAAQHGKSVVGFLNPLLYQIGASSRYNTDFHDITPPGDPSVPSNNDELGINGGAYPVTNDFDMATGWGSFDAAKLAADLVAMGK
ncbi:MAG TPA: S53 family peptidase [Ktedonobacteraceae bacterium]|nr:S53 family peptidase [Ktedonobacteraceae bacterium]